MIISKLVLKNSVYFNLHAEETITSNFFEDDSSGVYVDRLQIVTLNRVIKAIKDQPSFNVILDFENIVACQPNLSNVLVTLKKEGYNMLFLNLLKSLLSHLHLDTVANSKNILGPDNWLKFYFFEDSEHELTDLDFNTKLLFENEFKKSLKKFIVPHSKPHTSSFVYLTSFVNMKRFMSQENLLLLHSLYKLAMIIKRKWSEELKEEPILICQSLNSSYLASILSALLKLDILIFDNIGPVNRLYDRIENNISKERKYIIVSDFVCLGTEVKIVKNIIHFIGGKCLGNVSLIKTETLNNHDIKSVNATISVFSIKKENNKELEYNIITDLEPLT